MDKYSFNSFSSDMIDVPYTKVEHLLIFMYNKILSDRIGVHYLIY